jgi:hypothetical protein
MSQNMENRSNTETQVSVPKYLLGGYKMHITIENGENPRTVEINMGDDEEAFGFMFESFFSSGFNSGLNFLNKLIPQDEFVTDLINKYSKGSENRKIKKYPNGDYYEGKIVNEKANGFGELNIMINDLLFMKYTQYIGEFTNDTFFKGKIYCYNSDDEGDIIKFIDVEYADSKYKCRSIEYPNDDKFEGDVVNFKRHGKGKLTKADGSVIEGNWENDILLDDNSENDNVIKDKRTVGSVRIEYKNSINQLYSDKKYQEVINEAELAEIGDDDFFKDSFIADKYLWSLYVEDFKKAYKEIDRITKITSDKSKIQDIVGMIYARKGVENNDLNLLKNALQCFQSHDYSNKEFGTNRINNVQEKINNLIIQNKIKSLGINSILEEQFKNGNYTKLWKVNCFVNEPYYWNKKIDKWKTSNPVFYLPSNGIITEKGAIAFIKAKWEDIYTYAIKNSSWKKEGGKELDKTKIEIIEINEII